MKNRWTVLFLAFAAFCLAGTVTANFSGVCVRMMGQGVHRACCCEGSGHAVCTDQNAPFSASPFDAGVKPSASPAWAAPFPPAENARMGPGFLASNLHRSFVLPPEKLYLFHSVLRV